MSRSRALSLLAAVPLLLVGGVTVLGESAVPGSAERPAVTASGGITTRTCPGPLEVPSALLETGGDTELAITPPAEDIGVSTAALQPDSSVLYGSVSLSETRLDDSGNILSPQLAAAQTDGTAIEVEPSSSDVGATVQRIPNTLGPVTTEITAADEAGAVAHSVQSTITPAGDFRSLAVTPCTAPTSDALFLGGSTATGDSTVLRLQNTSQQPATAAVQVWTAEGPAQMEGRSQVVVPAGETEQVLLESVVPSTENLGVRVVTVGAPLSMSLQTTEREGLTPGGAEIQAPLPAPSTRLVIPGAHVSTSDAGSVTLLNTSGVDTVARVSLTGPDGPVAAAGLDEVELPAGQVVTVRLPSLRHANYTVTAEAEQPITGVVRSVVVGPEAAGDTIGAPVDYALAPPAPALSGGTVMAMPPAGGRGRLLLQATGDSEATVIPIGADGVPGDPISADLSRDRITVIDGQSLAVPAGPVVAVAISPDIPGDVHAAWVQREPEGGTGPLISVLPVPSQAAAEKPLSVRLAD